MASLMTSTVTSSILSWRSTPAASANFSTAASASWTFLETSCTRALALRSAVLFTNAAKRFATGSSCLLSASSISSLSLAISLLENSFSATLFENMKERALATAGLTSAIPASRALKAASASSGGKTSRPIMKGNSASEATAIAFSAIATRSAPALLSSFGVAASSFGLSAAAAFLSFSCVALARSDNLLNSSINKPVAALSLPSVARWAAATLSCAEVNALSTAAASSSDSSVFLTFFSQAEMASLTSASALSTSCFKVANASFSIGTCCSSVWSRFSGVTFFCASESLSC
mmetsp:Transcript_54106/g.150462  ORF Transcript_54106/g.150462 Transcript_54106/m.150462 type:complete len:292 (-) Transcript_54106:1658-2533(-)